MGWFNSMQHFIKDKVISVNISHDLQRQILEILSLFRVMNNYYNKKNEIQKQIQPLILKKFKESLETLKKKADWLFTIPIALNTLSEDFLSKKDSFRFPDSIILFEAWMNLGLVALYPRMVLHFKFPGFLKGEKTRNVFQFIYATSRGFGFPINFGPEFYGYELNYLRYLEPFLKWGHTVCHKINQAICLVNQKLKLKRHHPGEFESVIISEYDNNVFKGINTLLHGYFTHDPKYLGKFSSLEETLKNVIFSYTIGDHAMSVNNKKITNLISEPMIEIPLMEHDSIVQKYDIDFYSYIKKLMNVNKLLTKKILFYKKKRKKLFTKLKVINKIRYRCDLLIPSRKISNRFLEMEKYSHYKHIIEKLREFLWTTPLYTHTIHNPTKREIVYKLSSKNGDYEEFDQESTNSILLSIIKRYEREREFIFDDEEIITELKILRDYMARMWLYFKERQFRYAVKILNEISILSLDNQNYKTKINDYLNKLIPIFSIYELFNRPLAESVYPESIPNTKRLGAYLAKFFTSKYNPVGINLMNLFNKLAFQNWSFLIKKKNLNNEQFFNLILRLPIWKYIPEKIKMYILKSNY